MRSTIPNSTNTDDVRWLASAIQSALKEVLSGESRDQVRGLIEARTKLVGHTAEVPILEHIRRNAQARDAFVAECGGLLTSEQVAKLADSAANNTAQIAHRWRKEGKIFAVEHGRQLYFPALQFDAATRRPREAMPKLIKVLTKFYSGWSLALWFAGANAWLGGKRPFDLLERNPARVLAAAKNEINALNE